MHDLSQVFLSLAFLTSSIQFAGPLFAAAAGEAISEGAGVINIGIEGMMLTGAFSGFVGADISHNAWVGLLTGILGGIAIALPHGFVSINLAGNQIVSGVALNLTAVGLTTFLFRQGFGIGTSPQVAHFSTIHIPLVSSLPVLAAVFDQAAPIYVSVALAVVAWFLLFRLRIGLQMRASGQRPESLEMVGVSVIRTRWAALLVCAGLAGLAGTTLSLVQLNTFVEDMTGGIGFVVLALVIVARWNPLWTLPVGLFFGASEAVGIRVQALGVTVIPYQLWAMAPFLLTLVAYALVARSGRSPRALGSSYTRE